MERSGLSERSHSGKELLEILETYPRDELFQITTDDLYRTVDGRAAHGRPPPAAGVPAPRRVRPVLLLSGLLAPRPVHHRQPAADAGDPAARAQRGRAWTTPPGSPSRCWPGCTSSSAPIRSGHRNTWTRTPWPRRWPTRPDCGTTTSRWCWSGNSVTQSAKRAARPLRRSAARRLQGPAPAARGGPGSGQAGAAGGARAAGTASVPAAGQPRRRAVQGVPLRRADDAVGGAAGAALPRGARSPTSARTRSSAPTAPSTCTTSGCDCPPAPATRWRCGLRWRTPSPPPGGARPRSTGSTRWCCGPGSPGGKVVVLRAYAKYLRQAGTRLLPGVHGHHPVRLPASSPSCWSRCSRPGSTRALACSEVSGRTGLGSSSTRSNARWTGVASLDQDRILRSYLTLIQATLRTSFFQRGADGRPKSYVAFKLDPQLDPGPARAAAAVRDLRVLAPVRRGAPALRRGRPRRAALVGPARGLPHRDPRPGQGADGEERGDRAGRRQGRLRAQAGAGRPGRACRPRRSPATSMFISGLLDVTDNLVDGGGRAAARRGAPRRRRPVPGGRRGQGHRHLLRHRQRDLARVRVLARRRVRLRRLGRLRPQEDGHHRPGRLGVGQAPLPRAGRGHADARTSPSSASATCPATCSATGCCCSRAHPAGRRLRPPAHLRRPGPGPGARRTPSGERLFELPRSSWDDYDKSLISAGGGVFPRTAKSIPISPQMRRALGIAGGGHHDDARRS